MENIILYDWFSMTSQIDSPQSMIELLGLQDLQFVEYHGFYGYEMRLYYDGIPYTQAVEKIIERV